MSRAARSVRLFGFYLNVRGEVQVVALRSGEAAAAAVAR
jgi:hypothetical protein